MPVGHSHSFGGGRVFNKTMPPRFFRLISFLDKLLNQYNEFNAWNSFQRNSLINGECFIGPNAWCSNGGEKSNISFGSRVYCRGLLRAGVRTKKGKIILGNDIYIGDDVMINAENEVTIGDYTLIAHGVQINDTQAHPMDPAERMKDWDYLRGMSLLKERPEVKHAPIKIGARVWLSFNVIVLRGVTIGDNSIVAAGSVVTGDVPPNSVVAGNPARVVKQINL